MFFAAQKKKVNFWDVFFCSLYNRLDWPDKRRCVVGNPDNWEACWEFLKPLNTFKCCALVQQTWPTTVNHVNIGTKLIVLVWKPDPWMMPTYDLFVPITWEWQITITITWEWQTVLLINKDSSQARFGIMFRQERVGKHLFYLCFFLSYFWLI